MGQLRAKASSSLKMVTIMKENSKIIKHVPKNVSIKAMDLNTQARFNTTDIMDKENFKRLEWNSPACFKMEKEIKEN